LSIHSIRR